MYMDEHAKAKILYELLENTPFGESCKRVGITRKVGHRILKKYYPLADTSRKTILFDKTFFKEINSEAKAYFLGFIAADGCVYKDGLIIGLSSMDENILLEFKKNIKSDHRISKYDIRNPSGTISKVSKIAIYSRELRDDLCHYNITPVKSLTLIPPPINSIPSDLVHHFIRGYFDGDGSISYENERQRPQLNILGTKEFLSFISSVFFEYNIKHYWYKDKRHKSNTWSINIHSRNGCSRFFEKFYKNATIFLNRKYIKLLRSYEEQSKYIQNRHSKYKYITKSDRNFKNPWRYVFFFEGKKYSQYVESEEKCWNLLCKKYFEITGQKLS